MQTRIKIKRVPLLMRRFKAGKPIASLFFTSIMALMLISFWFISIFSLSGCKKATLTAPEQSTLMVTVNPSIIPVGGTATVRVLAYKASGTTVADGTVIYFSTDMGSIDAKAETTDGIANAVFTSSDNLSGMATITVVSGNAQVTPDPVTITIGTATSLTALVLSANPQTLPQQGGNSTIRVTAYDESMNPLSGIQVVLTASPAGVLNSNGSPLTTDDNGAAEDLLQTEETTTVTATSGGVTAELTVTVRDASAPTAAFTYSPFNPAVSEKVSFNASESTDSDGYIERYRWDFGDGHSGEGKTTSHRYTTAGKYKVVLTVTDNNGNEGSKSEDVEVTENDAPTADFVYSPKEPTAGDTVFFNASASSDDDGTITSYQWDFGDGDSGTGRTTEHIFQSAQKYTVTLVVTDDAGGQGTKSYEVTVSAAGIASWEPLP